MFLSSITQLLYEKHILSEYVAQSFDIDSSLSLFSSDLFHILASDDMSGKGIWLSISEIFL